MNIRFPKLLAGVLWLLLGSAAMSVAQRAHAEQQAGQQMSLSAAVAMVQGRFNATAVKTETVQAGDQVVYRIRLLSADKSRVWTVDVDARSGHIN